MARRLPITIIGKGAKMRLAAIIEKFLIMQSSARRKADSIVIGGLLLSLAGCAAVEKPQFTELLWPEPPLTSRIKFVGLLRDQNDLARSSGELFVEALLGPKKLPDSLQQPMGVAPSRNGKRLYVTDYAKPGVLVFDFEARRVSPLGGETNGFQSPLGIAVDEKDNVYVVDSIPKLIRVFDPSGKFLRNITHDNLERPTGIAVDPVRRRIYVADSAFRRSDNHVIRIFDMDGNYLKAFGGQGGEEGKFFFPTYLALDDKGNLYVTDTMNARVQIFDAEGRYQKSFGLRGNAFGMFDKPKGVALDTFGNVYVVDSAWSNVQIFNQRGEVLLFFGGRGRFPGLLFNPTGIAIDKDNRIYVADAFNGRIGIYQLINTKAEDSFIAMPPVAQKGG
jgi:DNA-binding beta-propeller fold protein YncE